MRIPRVGGRVIVVDEDGRTLLINERIDVGTHWLTPGGGVEGDEHPRDAARREVWEETGLRLGQVEAAGLVTEREWSWDGVTYLQTDHFFTARVPNGSPLHPRALTGQEQQTWLGFRWWTSIELRATDDVVVPPNLADVLDRITGAHR